MRIRLFAPVVLPVRSCITVAPFGVTLAALLAAVSLAGLAALSRPW